MPRYSLRLRNKYDDNEPTGAETLTRGIGTALQAYSQYQEHGREERNAIGQAGGEVLPDDPANSVSGRWDRLKRGIGSLLGHGIAGQNQDAGPTITSTNRDGLQPQRTTDIGGFTRPVPSLSPGLVMDGGHTPGTGWDERIPGRGGSSGSSGIGAMLAQAPGEHGEYGDTGQASPQTPQQAPARGPGRGGIGSALADNESYIYEGQGGMRARMPNAMGQARMASRVKNLDRDATQADQIASLVAAGMPADEARARVLNNVVRYDETFGQQRGSGGRGGTAMTQADRLEIQDRLDKRQALTRQLQRELANTRSSDSRRRMEIQQQLAEHKRQDTADDLLLRSEQTDATNAENRASKTAADPVASNTPGGKAEIARQEAAAAAAQGSVAARRAQVARRSSVPPAPSGGKRVIMQEQYDKARAAGHSDAELTRLYRIDPSVKRRPYDLQRNP